MVPNSKIFNDISYYTNTIGRNGSVLMCLNYMSASNAATKTIWLKYHKKTVNNNNNKNEVQHNQKRLIKKSISLKMQKLV